MLVVLTAGFGVHSIPFTNLQGHGMQVQCEAPVHSNCPAFELRCAGTRARFCVCGRCGFYLDLAGRHGWAMQACGLQRLGIEQCGALVRTYVNGFQCSFAHEFLQYQSQKKTSFKGESTRSTRGCFQHFGGEDEGWRDAVPSRGCCHAPLRSQPTKPGLSSCCTAAKRPKTTKPVTLSVAFTK